MITLTPAYGRDYKSQKEIKIDWENNKDFIIADIFHPYCDKPANKRDLKGETVRIRYQKLTKVMVLK
jgi:hypothetical protein